MRRRAMLVGLGLTVGAVGSAVVGPVAAAGAADAGTASVTVVHGLRGLVADITLDGKTVLQGFAPERSTDPLPVPAGPHQVEVRKAGDSGPPAITASVTLAAGVSSSLVAHLAEDGKPVLTAFTNNSAPIAAGQGRLSVRNTAVLPSAQFVVDGAPLGGVLASRQATDQDLPAGAHTVTVTSADGGQELLGAQSVQVPAASTTAIYLIGSPKDGSLGWLVQTLSAKATSPGGVPTGDSGLKDGSAGSGTAPALLAVLSVGSLGLGLRRRLR